MEPFLDTLLIDEAQDLPTPFFRLAHHAVKEPKRLVWAYDELQNLSDYQMPPVHELFGRRLDGSPVVNLNNDEGQPHKDVILRICYRNTPWALVTAHALGFGIYREDGLVQFFDEPQLWEEIGYETLGGVMSPRQSVVLRRREDSYPKYFDSLLQPEDAIVTAAFASREEQAKWIAEQIQKNLNDDELEYEDVLVIFPEPYTMQAESAAVGAALRARGLPSHVAGVSASQDELFKKNSVALCHIHRAKGNEAPIVYFANAHECYSGPELAKRRNILFTAITRSRAWVRIVGVGENMHRLSEEIARVRANNYQLKFEVPSAQDIARMRTIHRDMTEEDQSKLRKIKQKLDETKRLLAELNLDSIPPELAEQLNSLRGIRGGDDDAP